MSSSDDASLATDDLRARRRTLQLLDDAESYARRVAQVRLDLVRRVAQRRVEGAGSDTAVGDLQQELREVLSSQLTASDARPPRPTDDLSGEAPARELDELCSTHGLGRLEDLTPAELDELAERIEAFERKISLARRERHVELDALTAELVRRYRDAGDDLDDLLSG